MHSFISNFRIALKRILFSEVHMIQNVTDKNAIQNSNPASSDSKIMRMIFIFGPLSGLSIFIAELVSLYDAYLFLGDAIVRPRFQWHMTLRLCLHPTLCVFIGIAMVLAAVCLGDRYSRKIKELHLIFAPQIIGLVIFNIVFAARGPWGTVPETPAWAWIFVSIFSLQAVLYFSESTSEPKASITQSLWRAYKNSNSWPLGIGLLGAGAMFLTLFYCASIFLIGIATLLSLANLILLIFVCIKDFRNNRKRHGASTLAAIILLVIIGFLSIPVGFISIALGPACYCGNMKTIISMAKDFGGLADLPSSARNIDGIVTGGAFTLPVYLRFQADADDIDFWIMRSHGLQPITELPNWITDCRIWLMEEFGKKRRLFKGEGSGQSGTVIVNDETHTVFFYGCWS